MTDPSSAAVARHSKQLRFTYSWHATSCAHVMDYNPDGNKEGNNLEFLWGWQINNSIKAVLVRACCYKYRWGDFCKYDWRCEEQSWLVVEEMWEASSPVELFFFLFQRFRLKVNSIIFFWAIKSNGSFNLFTVYILVKNLLWKAGCVSGRGSGDGGWRCGTKS